MVKRGIYDGLEQVVVRIDSVLGGQMPTTKVGSSGQFLTSIAIDPEYPTSSANIPRPSGVIMPVGAQVTLSGSTLGNGSPMHIRGAAASAGVFIYASNGTLYTVSGNLSGIDEEGGVGQARNGASNVGEGNGAEYYNDYFYVACMDDIARFGRLSATGPGFANNYWISTLGQSALSSSATYPSASGVKYPSHPLFAHNDGNLYIGDYGANPNTGEGRNGRIHKISTASDGTGGAATVNALVLPPGFMPTDIKSYGTDLAIICIPEGQYAGGAIPRPGNASMFLWDTVSSAYYRHIDLGDPIASALVNKNGELFVFTGNIDVGVKLKKYLGGYSFQTVALRMTGSPPFQCAVDSFGNAIFWGAQETYPSTVASIFMYGYRDGRLPTTSLNNILAPVDRGTNSNITGLRFLRQAIVSGRYPYFGWVSGNGTGLDSMTSTNYNAVWRSQTFNIGKEFVIRRIRIPLTRPVDSGTSITVKVLTDSEYETTQVKVINSTNYPGSERMIDIRDVEVRGYSDFLLHFDFSGTTEVGVALPIIIELEIEEV